METPEKEAGLGAPTSKGIHPVWEYSLVPGGLEAIIRNLGLFSNTRVQVMGSEISRRLDEVKSTLNREVLGDVPAVIVLGGSDDGKVFLLKNDSVNMGRIDPASRAAYRPGEDIVLSRITRWSPACPSPMAGLSGTRMRGMLKTAAVRAGPAEQQTR